MDDLLRGLGRATTDDAAVTPESPRRRLVWWLVTGVCIVGGAAASFHFLTSSTRLVTSYRPVPFPQRQVADDTLLAGVEYTRVAGVEGSLQVCTKIRTGDDGAPRRDVVWTRVVKPPTANVTVRGSQPEVAASQAVTDVVTRYFAAWREGDYAAMLELCAPDSFRGHSAADIAASHVVTGDRVSSWWLDDPLLSGTEEALSAPDGSTTEEPLVVTDFPVGSRAVAVLPGHFRVRSPLLGMVGRTEATRAAYIDGVWRVVYADQLAAVRDGRARRFVSEGWDGNVRGEIVVEAVIVYADRVALVVRETNLSHTAGAGKTLDSQFESLGWSDDVGLSDDAAVATTYVLDADASSSFASLNEGDSQRGVLHFSPAPPADARNLVLRLPDVPAWTVPLP